MSTYKKHTNLTMQQRLDVLKELETFPVGIIAEKYCVVHSTIRRIRKNAATIIEFAQKSRLQKKRRRLRKPVYEELEHCLFTWFIERRTLGDIVTDALFLKKATELRDSMPSCSTFKVSKSWLASFKRRHDIRLVRIYDEKDSTDEDRTKTCVKKTNNLIEEKEENINVESIYKQEVQAEEYEEKEINCDNENQDFTEQKEILDPADQVDDSNELKFLFERLEYHTATAPRHVQLIVESLKTFLLSNTHS